MSDAGENTRESNEQGFESIVKRLTNYGIGVDVAISQSRRDFQSMFGISDQEMDAIVNSVRQKLRK